ncbi:MAG: hypothetical protein QY309_13255 [Cyclobacteriaceae bacterium]|nr:MAG: hypothetical protein QY309_13255 [Cyclobacteriaceae bacterium]
MTRTLWTLLFTVTTTGLFGQTLNKFNYSDCLKDCIGDSSKIQSFTKTSGLTKIKLRTFAPCGGNFQGDFELTKSGTLDLKFSVKPTIIKDKKGKTTELLEIADCNCHFDFTYEIKGLPNIDSKSITVNGQTLLEIDRQNFGIEIKIEFDSIR